MKVFKTMSIRSLSEPKISVILLNMNGKLTFGTGALKKVVTNALYCKHFNLFVVFHFELFGRYREKITRNKVKHTG